MAWTLLPDSVFASTLLTAAEIIGATAAGYGYRHASWRDEQSDLCGVSPQRRSASSGHRECRDCTFRLRADAHCQGGEAVAASINTSELNALAIKVSALGDRLDRRTLHSVNFAIGGLPSRVVLREPAPPSNHPQEPRNETNEENDGYSDQPRGEFFDHGSMTRR
jgi:hypothetical protein